MENMLQNIWPEWHIEKELGRGSYGVVYKASRNDHNLETFAAIKVISIPSNAAEIDTLRSEGLDMNATRTYLQEIVNDFVSEIRLMESLKGIQNIVSVEDYKVVEKTDEVGWNIYIRMELLTPFNSFICDKKLSESEVIKLGCDICTALEVCAKRNIIHRDIKPENIFINDFGDYKLGDFGIARKLENMTGGLSQKGTFNYMAPEVANSADYDARVDTYSLGIVLYRLLNGNRLPFLDTDKQLLNPNERKYAVERRIRGEALNTPCEASPAMANLILKACAFNPNDRFANASEMKAALMSVQNGTYRILSVDPDATTSVRRKVQNLDSTTSVRRKEQNFDGTTSVRHAPQSYSDNAPNTFGTKKKSKTPAIIAAILAVVLLVGGGFIAFPHIVNMMDSEQTGDVGGSEGKQNDTAKYSKNDNEQIASIISEAEAIVNNDVEGAIALIQTGLITYPKSADLQNKLDEYSALLSEQVKAEALEKSSKLADSGDYLGALQTVNQALKSVGNDNSLTAAAKTYEDAYAKSVAEQVDTLVAERNITSAKQLLEKASKEIPSNTVINARKKELDQYDITSLSKLKTVSGSIEWNVGQPVDLLGNSYFDSVNYGIIHNNNSMWSDTSTFEYAMNGKYSTFTFGYAPYSDFGDNDYANTYIQVFVDDEIKYTSPMITRKSKYNEVTINVVNGNYLKLVVNHGTYGCIIFTDMMVNNYPVSQTQSQVTSLTQCKQVGGEVKWNQGFPTDYLGNDYTNVSNYATVINTNTMWSDDEYCEFYLGGQYTSLTFTVAPYESFGLYMSTISNVVTQLNVSVDDIIVKNIPVNYKSKAETITVDVTGAEYIKFDFDLYPRGDLIISNALLTKGD